jgi:predicted Zn-ribbon and HTH transcriptional regulator
MDPVCIGKFKTKEANLLLQRFLKLNSSPVKREAILALLKNNQPVNAVEIEKLAADKSFRAGFYDDMKKINKAEPHPGKIYNAAKYCRK